MKKNILLLRGRNSTALPRFLDGVTNTNISRISTDLPCKATLTGLARHVNGRGPEKEKMPLRPFLPILSLKATKKIGEVGKWEGN
ncbi:MAG: hypothetical protein ABEK00_00590 [Candidatus Nanohaloarchaea archaeon]